VKTKPHLHIPRTKHVRADFESPVEPGALDRIRRVAARLEKSIGSSRSAQVLCDALADRVAALGPVLELLPRVMDGEWDARIEYRGWLGFSRGFPASALPCPEPELVPGGDPLIDGGRGGGPHGREACRTLLRLRVGALLAAGGINDYRTMRDGLDVLQRGADWIAAFDDAAGHYEVTGDGKPFETHARLYANVHGGLCDPGPSSPLTGDVRGCLAFLDSELERHAQDNDTGLIARSGPMIWADTITWVLYPRSCSGGPLEIHGHDFGDGQPDDVELLLPFGEDDCRPAAVPPGQWTDTKIWLEAPSWVSTGCVGFRRGSAARQWGMRLTAVERLMGALSRVSRVCTSTFGGAYEPVTHFEPGGGQCPPRTGSNDIVAAPYIRVFRVDGRADISVDSHAEIRMAWEVACAAEVTVLRNGPGPDVGPIAPTSFEERVLRLAVVTRQPSVTTYTLVATAANGNRKTATVTVRTTMSERNRRLMEIQDDVLARFGGAHGFNVEHSRGFHWAGQHYIAAHFNYHKLKNVCFAGNGLVFANTHDVDEAGPDEAVDPHNPSLLFFDRDHNLFGCGFFRPKTDTNHPSTFGTTLGAPPEEWFFHVAGVHLADGGFQPGPEPRVSVRNFTVTGEGTGKWHDRFWDIHLFFNLDGNRSPAGPPLVGFTTLDFDSTRNIPLSAFATPQEPCPGGLGDAGFYEHQ
jgi:hypothetical protein